MLTNDLNDFLRDEFNYLVRTDRPVTQGYLSTNWILSDGRRRLFLKRYRFDTRDRVEEVHRVKHTVATHGIPVILPLPNQTGQTIFEVNQHFYSLFPFVHGRHLPRGQWPPAALTAAAELLAKIHLLSRDQPLLNLPARPYVSNAERFYPPATEILKTIRSKTHRGKIDRVTEELLLLKKELVAANTINFADLNLKNDHLIHGDFQDANLFFDRKNQVRAIFDWEKANRAPRLWELMRSTFYICFDRFSERNFRQAAQYLKSYQHLYPFSAQELAAGLKLLYLHQIHGIWAEREHYLNHNHRVDNLLPKNLERLRGFVTNYQRVGKYLLTALFTPKKLQ